MNTYTSSNYMKKELLKFLVAEKNEDNEESIEFPGESNYLNFKNNNSVPL